MIHNDLFVLHLVNVFYFAQIPGSKDQFLLYCAAELVGQAGEILYTELSPDSVSTLSYTVVGVRGSSISAMGI